MVLNVMTSHWNHHRIQTKITGIYDDLYHLTMGIYDYYNYDYTIYHNG